jgi:AP-1 complex subunit mu
MDYGYPQMTDTKILKEFIRTESNKLSDKNSKRNDNKLTEEFTRKCSWRPDGIKYKNNEVYLDVIEKVNSLISEKGVVLRSEVVGRMNMRCFLTGIPNLKLGLNDKVFFELSGRRTY